MIRKENVLQHVNLCDYHEYKEYILELSDLTDQGNIVEEDGLFSLHFPDGNWLSAHPDGYFNAQPRKEGWEQFRLISPEDLPAFVPEFETSLNIPHHIHQKANSPLIPEVFKKNREQLLELNEGWQYTYWSNKTVHDFIYRSYGYETLESYLRINPRYGAARADLFRVLLIYRLGGVYLDIKSCSSVPFNNIFSDTAGLVLSGWGYNEFSDLLHIESGEFLQWAIIAPAGHALLKKAADQILCNIAFYDERLHGLGRVGTLRITGPLAYTRALWPHVQKPDAYVTLLSDLRGHGLIYDNIGDRRQHFPKEDYTRQTTPLVL